MGSLEKYLLFACFRGDIDNVKYLLEQGANMNALCPTGRTPFGVAAQVGNIEILELFLEQTKKYKKAQLKNSFKLKVEGENCLRKKSSQKNSKYNKGYVVDNYDDQNFLKYSSNHYQNKSKMKKENKERKSDSLREINSSLHCGLIDDSKTLMSTINNTAYNLATFNDTFVRRDPRFETKNTNDEVTLSLEDEELTPDGMDKLEWDMEIADTNDLVKSTSISTDVDDTLHDMYLWSNSILSETNTYFGEKPSPSDIDVEDQFGCRALHYATIEGHVEAMKLLINAGCNVNVGDSDNLTPLHLAAAKDSPEIVKLLIGAGANVRSKTTDRISPLHVSSSRGLLANVKLLVQAGSHIDTQDSWDRTPLFMAVSRSHVDVVDYLLKRGAKVNLEEIRGYTPLYEAVWQKNTTIVKMLLDAGAKITHSHHLLHYAVLHRHEEMVRLLISAGSIINLRDENGDTPLLVAAKTLQANLAKLLLMNGASLSCTNYVTGNTSLLEVIQNLSGKRHKFEEMFSVFQEYNVDLEAESDSGCTALWLAVSQRFDDAAATLVRHGADVNHQPILLLNLFKLLLLKGNRFLSELFICAGYKFQNIQIPEKPSTPLEKWISHLKVNPMKLCDLCRIKVRAQFKAKVYEKVSRLVLPSAIKTFLKLEDITRESVNSL